MLVVQRATDWDEAIALCNGVRQGLVAALFTNSRERTEDFLRRAKCGLLKINSSTADAAVDLPFGGWKAWGLVRLSMESPIANSLPAGSRSISRLS